MKAHVEHVLMFCIMVTLWMISGACAVQLLWSKQPQTLPRSDLENMVWVLYAVLLLGVTTTTYLMYRFFKKWIVPPTPGGKDGEEP